MNILLIIILILTSSCGVKQFAKDIIYKDATVEGRLNATSDPDFLKYITLFEETQKNIMKTSNTGLGDIPINYGPPSEFSAGQIGLCLYYSNNQREIIINKTWWQKATEEQKELLIIHEIGHCKFDRDHDDEVMIKNGVNYPLSIMNHNLISSTLYKKYKNEYLIEFHTLNKGPLRSAF